MDTQEQLKEVNEAIEAGRRALRTMNTAADNLADARNLGKWDILGGGFIAGEMKHSKIEDAQKILRSGISDLRRF